MSWRPGWFLGVVVVVLCVLVLVSRSRETSLRARCLRDLRGCAGSRPTGAARCGPASSTLGSGMAQGTVKWFNAEKGFGFISQAGGGPDVFVHYSEIASGGVPSLQEDQRREVGVAAGPQGPPAHGGRLVFGAAGR